MRGGPCKGGRRERTEERGIGVGRRGVAEMSDRGRSAGGGREDGGAGTGQWSRGRTAEREKAAVGKKNPERIVRSGFVSGGGRCG